MLKLYENIKMYRKELELSQEELAKMTGYSDRSAIAKIEAGVVDLSESKIMIFAKVFGVKPSVLMGWDKPSTPAASHDFSEEEYTIAKAYHNADEVDKEMVRRILKVEKKADSDRAAYVG